MTHAFSSPRPAIGQSPRDLIGHTPLVRVSCFDTGPCELYVKLESQNPGGSVKDRIGLSMIEAAEAAGIVGHGTQTELVEATAGNTGLGLAIVAAQRGYQLTLVIPDKMSHEKVLHARALGARVEITRSDVSRGHPAHYQDLAARLAKERGAYFVNQFENPANPLAHEQGTGPEIWEQTSGTVDAIVCGVGSGGTITGLSRCFARVAPHVEMVLADPEGSSLAEYVRTGKLGPGGSYLVEGVGNAAVPPVCDLSRTRHAYTVSDAESFATVRTLLKRESLLAGPSSGVLVAAAARYCREQTEPKRVVTFVCDTGGKYLSKAYDDRWLTEQGFGDREPEGDLRDLLLRRATSGEVMSVSPTDTLLFAHGRMRQADVSQLPVLHEGRLVGIVDESDLLFAVTRDEAAFRSPVERVMARELETVAFDAPLEDVVSVLARDRVAIVMDGERFLGLVTKIDLLGALRRRLR